MKFKMERLLDEVDSGKKELLKLASDLIQAESENPPGDTTKPAEVLYDYLTGSGLKVRRFEFKKGYVNLLTEVKGGGEAGLILCGHIDTVPTGQVEKWMSNPFSGRIAEGKIFGRGSVDMKGGVAAIAVALRTLSKFESQLATCVSAVFLCDEETGGRFGAKLMVSEAAVKGSCMVIGEPTNTRSSGHLVVAGERGTLWSRLRFSGVSRHDSLPMLGENAILSAIRAFSKLRETSLSKVRVPHDAKPLITAGGRVLKQEHAEHAASKPHRALNHYTVNLGVIEGGFKVNMIPDSCVVQLDMRIPLGGSIGEAERIMKTIGEGAEMEVFNYAPPSYTSPGDPLVRTMKKVGEAIFRDRCVAVCSPATSDARFFRSTLKIPVVQYGPGYESLAHTYNESVSVEDLLGCCKVYALTAIKVSLSRT